MARSVSIFIHFPLVPLGCSTARCPMMFEKSSVHTASSGRICGDCHLESSKSPPRSRSRAAITAQIEGSLPRRTSSWCPGPVRIVFERLGQPKGRADSRVWPPACSPLTTRPRSERPVSTIPSAAQVGLHRRATKSLHPVGMAVRPRNARGGADRKVHLGQHDLSTDLVKSWDVVQVRRVFFLDFRTGRKGLWHRCCNTLTTRPAATVNVGKVARSLETETRQRS